MPSGEVLASAHNLTVRYGSRVAVDNLTLELRAGELVLLLGPNGSGKSTTLLTLAGALRPAAGRVEVLGTPVYDAPEPPLAMIGLVDQPPSLYEFFSVAEHLRFVATARGAATEAAGLALAAVGLSSSQDRIIRELSFGMRQRVGLAAALIGDTRLLLLDETLNGLDPHATRAALKALAAAKQRGAAVLMSTHLLGSAERACDRVVVMQHGRLLADIAGPELVKLSQRGPTALEDLYIDLIPDDTIAEPPAV